MKTFEQHLQEEHRTTDNLYSIFLTLTNKEIEESVKAYATEAIKTDRERVAEEVYMKHNGSHQCKQSILNLPIELK